jgi:regulator of sirC expression with transglutaminase-like and TPR domain
VLRRRRGLPILPSVLWLAVAERAGVELAGVGLPGHFVVAHLGAAPPLVLDPFRGGGPYAGATPPVLPLATAHDIALRMLNNLVGSYERRLDPGRALRAARLRLLLPAEPPLREHLEHDARRLAAAFN